MNKNLSVMAVCDESGDATFWEDGFVYVTDSKKYDENIDADDLNISDLDNADKGIANEYSEHEALVYAVSLKDLVQAAIESGLMDKLQRKTRYNM
jgi:hypothetical protein